MPGGFKEQGIQIQPGQQLSSLTSPSAQPTSSPQLGMMGGMNIGAQTMNSGGSNIMQSIMQMMQRGRGGMGGGMGRQMNLG